MPVGPAELNVFCLPHIKIKEITEELDQRLSTVCSEDDRMFQNTIDYLKLKFLELKSHEDIENHYIMKPLLPRLKECTNICLENDIHGDDRLEELMKRIEDVRARGTWSLSSRIEFLVSMREDIQNFIRDLLPHLVEEEEVYQPLLLEHFSREELQDLREVVLELHHISPNIADVGDDNRYPEPAQTKHSPSVKSSAHRLPGLSDLPEELLVKIFKSLSPKDLCSLMQCSRELSRAAKSSRLWQHLHPMRWFAGHWQFFKPRGHPPSDTLDDFDDSLLLEELPHVGCYKANAWTTNSEEEDDVILKKEKFLSGFMKSVLSVVGEHVVTLSLASGGEVDSDLVSTVCPTLVYLKT
jgi:F-box/leucine-rich repeat protein 5